MTEFNGDETQEEPFICVRDLFKTYGQGHSATRVLRGLSCEIPRGEFTFVIGPSGSGKSTLLYLLGALDEPDAGEILFDGKKLGSLSSEERNRLRRDEIGFVFQNFNLLGQLNAVDNVLVPLLPAGRSEENRARAIELLRRVGLGERLTHRPHQLSGGEQQRVAIARAILRKPRLILADEPTGELDSRNGREIFQLLRDLQREHGVTVVTVTHDHSHIHPGDRLIELLDGELVSSRIAGETVGQTASE